MFCQDKIKYTTDTVIVSNIQKYLILRRFLIDALSSEFRGSVNNVSQRKCPTQNYLCIRTLEHKH